ncbi:MAG: hypothetical protein ACYTDY_06265 [Planctomycetota bacterium]
MAKTARLLLIALLAALLIPTGIARADGDDDKKERDRRLRELEERLKGKTPQERKELMERLRRLRKKTERERQELRRKHQKTRRICQHIEKDLPPELRKKLDGMPRDRRRAVLHYAVHRMLEVMREQFLASLTRQERARVGNLKGRDHGRALFELKKRKLLARLTPEQRAAVESLPEKERHERIRHMMRRAHEAERKKARERLVGELRTLLDLPPEELDRKLRSPWVQQELRRLGFADRELLRKLLALPQQDLRRTLAELKKIRQIRDPEARRAALARLKARLPK